MKSIDEIELFMCEVISTNVLRLGFDVEEDIMYVKYKGGKIYAFVSCPYDVFSEIRDSPSVGKALATTGMKGILVT